MLRLKQIIAALLLLPCLAGVGIARERHHGDDRARWRGEISRFHEHDLDHWRGGRWHHGRHQGRSGWWWIVAGIWYFYPQRVEPYPDPYQPPVVMPPPPVAAPHYWYYCSNPAGYYPYIPRCAIGWQRIPASVVPPR